VRRRGSAALRAGGDLTARPSHTRLRRPLLDRCDFLCLTVRRGGGRALGSPFQSVLDQLEDRFRVGGFIPLFFAMPSRHVGRS
jgi:hypothetical protein